MKWSSYERHSSLVWGDTHQRCCGSITAVTLEPQSQRAPASPYPWCFLPVGHFFVPGWNEASLDSELEWQAVPLANLLPLAKLSVLVVPSVDRIGPTVR